MRNIILLFAKYGSHLLFVGLQILCFYLIVNYNQTQREIYLNSSSILSGSLEEKVDGLSSYINLKEVNDSLLRENASLRNKVIRYNEYKARLGLSINIDSSFMNLIVTPVNICGASLGKRNNSYLLCKGKLEGISEGMGILTEKGILGVVRHVSNHYANVLPIIHGLSRTAVMIKNRNFIGIMMWDDTNPKKMLVEDVPKYANIAIGDTIITSGYSSVFPKGIGLGTITNFTVEKGSATYNIEVELWEDVTRIEYAYVISNAFRSEIDSLQNLISNE